MVANVRAPPIDQNPANHRPGDGNPHFQGARGRVPTGGQPDVGETLATVSSGPGGQARAFWAACGPSAVRFAHGKGSCCPSTAFACCSGLREIRRFPPARPTMRVAEGCRAIRSAGIRSSRRGRCGTQLNAAFPEIADGSSLGCPPPRWSTGRLSAGLRRVGWTSGRHGDGTGQWAAGPVTCRDRTVQLNHLRPARSIGR
jgi:hypothetical protein